MAETVDQIVEAAKAGETRPVYLLSGDEFLVRQAVGRLVDALVPASARDFNLVELDGAVTDAKTIASHLAQVPMFPGIKLVVVLDTTLLSGKQDLTPEVERAATLLADGKEKLAARRILSVLSRGGWSVDDLTGASHGRWHKELGVDPGVLDEAVLARLAEVVSAEGLRVPEGETETLERLLAGGAPGKNLLVLTCEKPDRRLSITRHVESEGVHLVLKAEQRGRSVDTLDIGAVTGAILAEHGKTLDRDAELALKRAIGGEMRLIAGELEKLCLYVGDRRRITLDDIESVGVTRVREEAFWELGSAASGRDLAAALWYAHDAFDHGRHPIPMVASIAGAVRRTLEVRTVADRHGVRGRPRNLPAAVVDEVAKARGGRKPHPFALLKEWERSRAWSGTDDLARGLRACRDADAALKRSRGDPRLVVERLLVDLCGRRP